MKREGKGQNRTGQKEGREGIEWKRERKRKDGTGQDGKERDRKGKGKVEVG